LPLFNELKSFYESAYYQLGYTNKINAVNLSMILSYMEVDIVTNIENNIKMNFDKYVRQFVNESFKAQHYEIAEKEKNKKVFMREQLKKKN